MPKLFFSVKKYDIYHKNDKNHTFYNKLPITLRITKLQGFIHVKNYKNGKSKRSYRSRYRKM